MGCGASGDGQRSSSSDPELIGKAKFLSCPSYGDITHPTTHQRWFLMVFAPQTHHGLIFVARNYITGDLLVKDIVDKEVASEKDEQHVGLSYNLFFKAISNEVSKAGKTGAKVTFMPDGSLEVECKIAVQGQLNVAKKPDSYSVTLRKIESTTAAVFRYILEPLATHYSKKRADGWNLDKPDPFKEKMYGEFETNAIVKGHFIQQTKAEIERLLPKLCPLRDVVEATRLKRDAALARLQLMKAMVAEKRAKDVSLIGQTAQAIRGMASVETKAQVDEQRLTMTPFTRLVDSSLDVRGHLQQRYDEAVAAAPANDAMFDAVQRRFGGEGASSSTGSSSSSGDPPSVQYLAAGLADHTGFSGSHLQELTGKGNGLAAAAYAVCLANGFHRTLPGFKDADVRRFFASVAALHPTSHAYHCAERSTERVVALHRFFFASRVVDQLALPIVDQFALVCAAVTLDAAHLGLANRCFPELRDLLVGSLYAYRSPQQRLSCAVSLHVIGVACPQFPLPAPAKSFMVESVLNCDDSKIAGLLNRFTRRAGEVSSFARHQDDSRLAAMALLRLADWAHVTYSHERCEAWVARFDAELSAQQKLLSKQFGLPHDTAIQLGEEVSSTPTARGVMTAIALPFFEAVAKELPLFGEAVMEAVRLNCTTAL